MITMTDEEWVTARDFKLRPLEARAFVALRDCTENYCPRERIHDDRNTCKVLISILRSKLGPHVRILNIRGRGYLLKFVEAA